MTVRERELKRWTPSEDSNVDMSLESTNGGAWDQFAANEQKFGLKSDYNEDFYTTSLDRTSANYRQNEARAAQIAREIEGTGGKNNRARDEEEGDEDEEEKYVFPNIAWIARSLLTVSEDIAVFGARRRIILPYSPATQTDTCHQHGAHQPGRLQSPAHPSIQLSSHLPLFNPRATRRKYPIHRSPRMRVIRRWQRRARFHLQIPRTPRKSLLLPKQLLLQKLQFPMRRRMWKQRYSTRFAHLLLSKRQRLLMTGKSERGRTRTSN